MYNFWLLITVLFSVYIILTIRAFSHKNIFTASLYNLIGTFSHELSHFVVAFIFNAKPTSLTLIPRKAGDVWILGGVTCRNVDWYNAFPVGVAPIVLAPLSYMLYISNFELFGIIMIDNFIRVFVAVVLLYSSIPSMQDIKVAVSKPIGVMFYGGIVITVAINILLSSGI